MSGRAYHILRGPACPKGWPLLRGAAFEACLPAQISGDSKDLATQFTRRHLSQALLVLAQLGGGSGPTMFIWIAALFAIMYFVMIRPQQKQMKEHRALLAALKKGDDVITQGGILGRSTWWPTRW